MAYNSLNDHAHNQKSLSETELPLFDLRDKLIEELRQAVALASVANCEDFFNIQDAILQDYVWVLRNIVISALDRYLVIDTVLDKKGIFNN